MVREAGAKKDAVVSGRWWRCSAYELIDGLVVPAAGSEIEQYDPWLPILGYRTEHAKKASPYDSLITLVSGLKVGPGVGARRYSLPAEDEARVLEWCVEHGLLGILPTRTQMISLHPRWERGDQPAGGASADRLYPVQRGWVLSSIGWVPQSRRVRWRSESAALEAGQQGPKEGDLAPLDVLSYEWPRPGVLIRPIDRPTWTLEPFSESWARYFRVPEGARTEEIAWPSPVSEEFCRTYSEPLDDFLLAATMLSICLTELADAQARPENSRSEDDRVRTGLARLNLLSSSVHPILLPSHGSTYQQRWLAPTLLSSYAMMVLLDLADPSRRPVRCVVCSNLFHSSSPTAEYCSERCRDTAYKRRKRTEIRKKVERAKRQHARRTKR